MILNPPPLNGALFSRSKSDRTKLVAEASDLPGRNVELHRLFDDACDVGIAIMGKRHVIRFYHLKTEQRDGDTLWWEFAVLPADAKKSGGIVSVVIFND